MFIQPPLTSLSGLSKSVLIFLQERLFIHYSSDNDNLVWSILCKMVNEGVWLFKFGCYRENSLSHGASFDHINAINAMTCVVLYFAYSMF